MISATAQGTPSDWRNKIIAQTCSSSVSLLASTIIVSFIIFGKTPPNNAATSRDANDGTRGCGKLAGLQTPYRRLIFSLSVTDIIQSSSILFGPLLTPSDQIFAYWGLGNKLTCQIDGFMFLVGTTAVPMYTCALCIYYVRKLKYKMTDEAFAHKYEKKMHVGIIAANLLVYFTALVMDVIHTNVFGNLCTTASSPQGCRLYPEIVGECDAVISRRVTIFMVFNSFLNPVICYIGIISSIVIILSHAIFREKMFGTRTKLAKYPTTATTSTQRDSNGQNIASDDTTLQSQHGQDQDQVQVQPQPQRRPELPKNNEEHIYEKEGGGDNVSRGTRASTQPLRTSSKQTMTASEIEEKLRDQETISRLYKTELVTQASCYVLVFCLTTLPYLIMSLTLISGSNPTEWMMWANVLLGPLGGLFNILVYTRPNVASLKRRHPDCSWLWALCLVLRAGGEVPEVYPGSFCSMLPWGSGNRQSQEDAHDGMIFDSAMLHFYPSSQPIGVIPSEGESIPNSAHGVNGLSLSIDEKHAMYRLSKDWSYIKGGAPRGDNSQDQNQVDVVAGSQDLADFDDLSSRMDSSGKWLSYGESAGTVRSSNSNDGHATSSRENEITDSV